MNREDMDRVIQEHFVHEATDDVEGVLASLTDDVVHEVVGSPWGKLTGAEAVRPFYVQLFRDLKGEEVQPIGRWYGDDFVFDVTLWTGWVEDGRMFGLPGKSGRVSFRLLHLFEFRDGLISKENVWSDTVRIAEQVG